MKVIIYTTPTCPYCEMAKEYFKKNNVAYEEIDVAGNKTAAQEMINKSHQMGVPVIDIDGTIIVGFNRPEIDKALSLAK